MNKTTLIFEMAVLYKCFNLTCCLLLLTTVGCKPGAQIKEQTVPQPAAILVQEHQQELAHQSKPATAGTDDRMLGAIYPQEEQIWFFKLTGPNAKVKELEGQFTELLKSISFKDQKPEWKLPAGWTETGEKSMFRYATFKTAAEEDAPVCTVSELPNRGDYDGMTLDNINRWRGQLGLENMSRKELFAASESDGGIKKLEHNGNEIRIVNLVGTMKKDTGMQAPFMSNMSKSTAPTQEEKSPQPEAEDGYTMSYQPIKGWDEIPQEGFHRARFIKSNDKDENLILTVVSVKSLETGLLENINIWRKQLGLEAEEKLPAEGENFQPITISDRPAHKIVLDGRNNKDEAYTIVAAILKIDDEQWFFKIIGNTGLAHAEIPQFDEFLKSVVIKKVK